MKFGAVVLLLVAASPLGAQGGSGMGNTGGFGGPSIQGRGGGGGKRQSDGLRIRPYVGVQAIYDSGLTSIQSNPNPLAESPTSSSSIVTRGAGGLEVMGGLYGTKEWKRNQLRVSYAGDYRHYNNGGAYNGSDQSLNLTYSTVVTKRVSFDATLSGGTTNRAFGGISSFNANDGLLQPGLPTNSLFDVRTNYGSANAGMTYSFSPRTSASFTGGSYVVKRQNSALFSVTGFQARGDVARRLDRRTTIGIDYDFATFQFSKAFGDSYIHGVGFFVARQFGRRWELNARIGGLNVEMLGKRQVQIDPAIAALIGVSVGEEVFYQNAMLGSGSVSLTRASREGTLGFQFSRSVNPGNGVVLTSQADVAGVTYSRRLSRTLNVDFNATRSRLRGLGLVTGDFVNYNAGVGFGWQVGRWAQLTARYDRRNTSTSATNTYNLNGNRVAFGVMFTPADLPVSLW